VPQTLAAVAFALLMIVLEVTVPYHRYARVLRWLALSLLAVFGTTVSPYLFFWQAGEEVEEQADHHQPADGGHLAAMRVDVAAGWARAWG
jgi:Mn2+/Fe2+ NRAMP family transporter